MRVNRIRKKNTYKQVVFSSTLRKTGVSMGEEEAGLLGRSDSEEVASLRALR